MPRPTRCAYREGKTQCRRIGQGNPPLCRPHRALLENDMRPASIGESLGNFMGKVFRGEKITRDDLGGAFVDSIRMAAAMGGSVNVRATSSSAPPPGQTTGSGVFDWAYEQLRQREAEAKARAQANQPPPPKAVDVAACCKELGWKPGRKFTLEDVAKRRRELARKFHPDRPGGSVKRMQAINAAADELVRHLERV